MTMCAVAKAQMFGNPRLAFCCDYLVSNDYAENEVISKYEILGDGLMAAYSGPLATCREVARLYRKRLNGVTVSDDNIYDLLSAPMRDFRQRVAARANIIPETPPVDFIVFGFVEAVPRIFHVSQKDEKVAEEDFAYAIGSGSYAASTMMEWRGISEESRLDEVLYALYEGKSVAETGPPVGKKMTMLAFIEPDGQLKQIAYNDMSLLVEAFDRFGPKPLPLEWHLPGRITGAVARSVPQSTTDDSQSPLPSPE